MRQNLFIKAISIFCAGSFLFGAFCFAQEIPPLPPGEVILDEAGVLSPEEKASITQFIQRIEAETKAEIALWILPRAEDDLSFLAVEAGRKWGVGKKGWNNGLVILISVEDRAWFIATGYGLESVLPDIRLYQLSHKIFPKYFAQKQYAEGIKAFLEAIFPYLVTANSEADFALSTFSLEKKTFLFYLRFHAMVSLLFFFLFLYIHWKTYPSKLWLFLEDFWLNLQMFPLGLALLLGIGLLGYVVIIPLYLVMLFERHLPQKHPPLSRPPSRQHPLSSSVLKELGKGLFKFGGGTFGGGGAGGRW